jgi:hypothetical protein
VPPTAGVICTGDELVGLWLVLAGQGLEEQRPGIADPVEHRLQRGDLLGRQR